jgi:hypothetical protein
VTISISGFVSIEMKNIGDGDNKFTKPPFLVRYLLFAIALIIVIELLTPITSRDTICAERGQATLDGSNIASALKAYK